MRRYPTHMLLFAALLGILGTLLAAVAPSQEGAGGAPQAAMVRICRNNRGVYDRRACRRDERDDSKRLLIASR